METHPLTNSISAAFDLLGPLLLDPVAGSFDDQLSFQVRQHAFDLLKALGADQSRDDGVGGARDEQRWLVDNWPSPCSSRKSSIPLAEMVRDVGKSRFRLV